MEENRVAKATSSKIKQRASGIVGLRVSSGIVTEEFLTTLQWPEAAAVYQEMSSNDAVIGACLYLIETVIRKATWRTLPASNDAGDIEAADFLESCMFDMQKQTWDDFVCEVLSMLIYGFSFHEIVYKTRRGPLEKDPKFKSNYTDGKLGWMELPLRSQSTLSEWVSDPATNEVSAFRQDPSLVNSTAPVVDIPIEGNLLFKTRSVRGNPEGWSLLRKVYRSWYFKRYIEELEGVGIERNLAGIPVLQPAPEVDLFNKEDPVMVQLYEWAETLVTNLRNDKSHGVIIPGGWTLKLMGAEGAGKTVDTDTAIRRYEMRMAMAMLSDIVLMGGDRTGSFALADTKLSLFLSSIQAIVNSICSTLNTYAVPQLFALNNWTLEKLPRITAENFKAPSISELSLLLRAAQINPANDPKLFNYVLNLMQAPEMSDEEYNAFVSQAAKSAGPFGGGQERFQDTSENSMKQSDESYTGQEGSANG